MPDTSQVITVDGHRIKLTNLDKVLYPETGTTKADVLSYYAAVADVLIPHAANRPVTRKRWVHGVGTADEPGQMFFQKNLDASTPSWVKRGVIQHSDHVNEYPLVNNLATLTWLAQIAALEIHVPQWQFGRNGRPRNPDRLVLDLDPGDGVTLPECAEVARLARAILQDMGLEPMPVTSGSKGIHLYAALDMKYTSTQVSDVAHELARALEADHPDLIVSDMKKSLRPGKVLVDWSQNNANKTTITPYSLRGRLRPTVAVPRTWRELASKDLEQLDYEQVMKRMRRREDPLGGLAAGHLDPDATHGTTTGDGAKSGSHGHDRLAVYRSKRDGAKTPEPVPTGPAAASAGVSFVIQEHHASRLHWDFRLEHDGVLVSWALPKGVPTDTKQNHLAVQTEDHPLEYGSFEGEIPAGEYGAGDVTIWDSGTYELEKWREGEVIATLHGEPDGGLDGPRKFALIHTGGEGKAAQNWLIHLMKPATSGSQHASTTTGTTLAADSGHPRATAQTPRSYSPMLATLGSESDLHHPEDWAFEMKWDGIRALAYVAGRGSKRMVRLVTRNGNDVTVSYPDLLADLSAAVDAESAVLDGEIVALDSTGRPDFGRLQTRMKLTAPGDVRAAVKNTPVQYLLFDVLERDGTPVVHAGYDERRAILESLVASTGTTQVPPAFDGDYEHAFSTSRELGLEGVMAKERDAGYSAGRRSRSWIKIKHHLTQEVVIGGWKPGSGRRAGGVGSLLMGIPEKGGLRYVGKVGTGFQDRDLRDMAERFAPLATDANPFADASSNGVPAAEAREAEWVRPTLVGEVEFAEWTATGRLRQPSWRGWRPDKSPDAVVRE
ncbi:ATP-dependent DNA ligase [Glaciibacter sp. 2TAF33]|uniref:ATP-dependent DNA ligase n=1 Tax=Glaciibacter sp. 2TAF33 TaxID=3233015 RepID=UPI003F90454A